MSVLINSFPDNFLDTYRFRCADRAVRKTIAIKRVLKFADIHP